MATATNLKYSKIFPAVGVQKGTTASSSLIIDAVRMHVNIEPRGWV
jgi:hypothetical protein